MTLTFNDVLAKRRVIQSRIQKAALSDDGDEDLRQLIKEAQEGELSIRDARVALRELDVLLEAAGELVTKQKGKQMTTKTFSTKADVIAEVDRLAAELRKKEPKLSAAEARAKVWEEREDLTRQYQELPEGEKPQKNAGAVRKGQSIVDRVNSKAVELMKRDASLTPGRARSLAWEQNPDLVEQYRRAISG